MPPHDINSVTLGQILGIITAVGVLSGFFGKFFSQIYKIKNIIERQEKLEYRMKKYEDNQDKQKGELLDKVEETNIAVNLLCSAISAMIDNTLGDNNNLDRLRHIKNKLDEKKEIV